MSRGLVCLLADQHGFGPLSDRVPLCPLATLKSVSVALFETVMLFGLSFFRGWIYILSSEFGK